MLENKRVKVSRDHTVKALTEINEISPRKQNL
jgi:hypothetical protein